MPLPSSFFVFGQPKTWWIWAIKEYLEDRSGERNMDSRIQIQLEEDGGGSTRQSRMETRGLWSIFLRERQGISLVCQATKVNFCIRAFSALIIIQFSPSGLKQLIDVRRFVTNAADKHGKSSRAVTDYRPPCYGLL